jgi:hypothetical protein
MNDFLKMAMGGQHADAALPERPKKQIAEEVKPPAEEEDKKSAPPKMLARQPDRSLGGFANLVQLEEDETAEVDAVLAEVERMDLDNWWSDTRKRVVKGSKPTRRRRLDGCLKKMQATQNKPAGVAVMKAPQNTVPGVRTRTEQPYAAVGSDVDTDDPIVETSLSAAIARFRGLQEAEELSTAEKLVLGATFSFKSQHMGRDRRQMLNLDHLGGEEESGMSKDDWDATKAGLIAKKLLRKNGALSPAGKKTIKAHGGGSTILARASKAHKTGGGGGGSASGSHGKLIKTLEAKPSTKNAEALANWIGKQVGGRRSKG